MMASQRELGLPACKLTEEERPYHPKQSWLPKQSSHHRILPFFGRRYWVTLLKVSKHPHSIEQSQAIPGLGIFQSGACRCSWGTLKFASLVFNF